MTAAAFEPIVAPKKPAFLGMTGGVYKIYKAPGDFIVVNANSALEAIKNSGVESILRVERDSLDKNYVLDLGKASEMLFGKDQPAADAAPTTDTAAPAVEAAPAADAPKA